MDNQADQPPACESPVLQDEEKPRPFKTVRMSLGEYMASPSYLIAVDNSRCPTVEELKVMFAQTTATLNDAVSWPFSSVLSVLHMPDVGLTEIDERITYFKNLKFLNMSFNEIEEVPGSSFWKELTELEFLYLNNNKISRLGNALCIRNAPSLTHLSLHDNPVEQTEGYRHIMLNKITTLVELDDMVAADEEFIEGIEYPERFAAFEDRMRLTTDNSLLKKKDTTYEELLDFIKKTSVETHKILSHNSPITIIQKVIRGFIIRVY